GRARGAEGIRADSVGAGSVVVDETFREFTDAPSLAPEGRPGLWVVGSFTKIYGADALRVGFVLAPGEGVATFALIRGALADAVPSGSCAGAAALLRHRPELLADARGLFERNRRTLAEAVPGIPDLAAPVWFDRGRDGLDGDRLARAAIARGVLVAPGSLFGDPTGVRITLTRRSFPEDLAAYVAVRRGFVDPG
ncbi:MAG: aminotransferase class I/II-fold pyridoxal phosphate-dependent enzyme, partial [Thermoplasmata archaeon]